MPPIPARRFDPAATLAALVIACALPLGAAVAQPSDAPPAATQSATPSRDIPRPDQLEPGVDTTPAPPAAPGTRSSAAPPAATAAHAARSANTTPATAAPAPKAATASGPSARKGPDRLQLDPTEITGNRELPKVLYIVPWKRSDLGDLAGRPVNSLLDEVLQPLDRDVFQRENRYYDALKPAAAATKAPAPQGAESKP